MKNMITDYTNVNGITIATYNNITKEYDVFEYIDELPTQFPSDMIRLICNGNWIKHIPDTLPDTLKLLSCCNLVLRTLPENLPNGLKELKCHYNKKLTSLPKKLPPRLRVLECSYTAIKIIDWLPPSLEILVCNHTPLEKLPPKLPTTLTHLVCNDTLLTSLPELPNSLVELWLPPGIKIIPDLPESICYLNIQAAKELYDTYPLLKMAKFETCAAKIEYINGCNESRRTRARLAIINKDNMFWREYMRRVMHPKYFGADLIADENIDIDEHIKQYLEKI